MKDTADRKIPTGCPDMEELICGYEWLDSETASMVDMHAASCPSCSRKAALMKNIETFITDGDSADAPYGRQITEKISSHIRGRNSRTAEDSRIILLMILALFGELLLLLGIWNIENSEPSHMATYILSPENMAEIFSLLIPEAIMAYTEPGLNIGEIWGTAPLLVALGSAALVISLYAGNLLASGTVRRR